MTVTSALVSRIPVGVTRFPCNLRVHLQVARLLEIACTYSISGVPVDLKLLTPITLASVGVWGRRINCTTRVSLWRVQGEKGV